MEKSLEEQLAETRRENERLRRALEDCLSARQKVEQDLERSHEEARAATEDLQHLIYAVSHDLRTPLRAIASYTQLLQRQHASDTEAGELSTFAAQGVKEMNTLIEDLLKYSRAGNSPRRTNVSLNSVVQWAVMNVQPALRSTGGEILFHDLPTLNVDESQFVQLFQQLFANALTFRSEAPPRIQVSGQESDEGYIISVQDNGGGIEPQYLETVFMPFKRLQGKSVPGNGLGLPICRKIVRAHGGRIWAESAGKGHGAVLKFTVPF
ncbi:MAG TPA: ATP-binding protein [Bryobacteraceae bacterium]|nr:ATP-binding protein [Bryobacteraceae bacterium]